MSNVISDYTLLPSRLVVETHKDQEGTEVFFGVWRTENPAEIDAKVYARAVRIEEHLAQVEFDGIITADPILDDDPLGGRT